VALGIISRVQGSSPQKVGAKALFHRDGRIEGTLGGGCLEAEIQRRALQALQTGWGATFELVLDHDLGWDDGLVCGGKVRGLIVPNAQQASEQFWTDLAGATQARFWGVRADYSVGGFSGEEDATGEGSAVAEAGGEWLYREKVAPRCGLWIAGAGHIAQAVAPLALSLDFAVAVFDDRPALAHPRYFPAEVALHADVWEKLLASPLPAAPSFGLIVTRGHRHDAQVLANWIHRPFRFLAMIGSARKARTIFEHFAREGLATAEELQRVACPAGVKIRCQTVMEIAVSIMAQFIDQRAGLAG
jgi:xanthine dehydrogenase accessory factor